jgi:diacylglycerol kinase
MSSTYKHRKHHLSLQSAISGILLAFKAELNIKLIILFAIVTLAFGVAFQISYMEWLAVIMAIMIVLLAEMINTSIESVTDLITKDWNEDAKAAKDIAGGMVLIACFGAFIIGLVIFLPRILLLLKINYQFLTY